MVCQQNDDPIHLFMEGKHEKDLSMAPDSSDFGGRSPLKQIAGMNAPKGNGRGSRTSCILLARGAFLPRFSGKRHEWTGDKTK